MTTGNCPVCDKPGKPVSTTTVKALTKSKEDLSNQTFNICLTPECRIVYYSPENLYTQDYIKTPIWFKINAEPKYICYCAEVTEEQILQAIEDGATSLKEVIKKTGAMQNSNCKTKNPTGECCSQQIKEILDRKKITAYSYVNLEGDSKRGKL